MSDPIKNGYVNWIDGMKISRGHFLELQQAAEARFRDTRAILTQAMDFGVVPGGAHGKASLDYVLTIEGRSKFNLRLSQCRAITPSGDRIEVLDAPDQYDQQLVLASEIPQAMVLEGAEFDVIVRADPDIMEPFGVPNPQESPPRHPFARPRCTLEWVPVKDMRHDGFGRHHLAIARMRIVKDELVHDQEFMPACMSMDALPRLEEFYREYFKFLKEMERNLFRIAIRLNKRETTTELSDSVGAFCLAAIGFLERDLGLLQVHGASLPPRRLVLHAVGFARTLLYAIELLTGKGKDGLLDYVREVIALPPAEYMATITALTDMDYDHTDLKAALGRILIFCRTQKKLLDEWVGLDYIGAKKDKNIFIEQETPVSRQAPPKSAPVKPPPPEEKGGWNF